MLGCEFVKRNYQNYELLFYVKFYRNFFITDDLLIYNLVFYYNK